MRSPADLAHLNAADFAQRPVAAVGADTPTSVACNAETTQLTAEPLNRFRTDSKRLPPGAAFAASSDIVVL